MVNVLELISKDETQSGVNQQQTKGLNKGNEPRKFDELNICSDTCISGSRSNLGCSQ